MPTYVSQPKIEQTNYSKLPPLELPVGASTTIVMGDILYMDASTHAVKPVTGAAGTVLNIVGMATEAITTGGGGSGIVKAMFLDQATLVDMPCTNATAANQLMVNHAMTDAQHVANTSSNVATTLGIFRALGLVGTNGLKGYFINIGQVTA